VSGLVKGWGWGAQNGIRAGDGAAASEVAVGCPNDAGGIGIRGRAAGIDSQLKVNRNGEADTIAHSARVRYGHPDDSSWSVGGNTHGCGDLCGADDVNV